MEPSATPYFVDTPKGIFTAAGTWYRARLADLEAFAGEVLDREGPERLLQRADVWLDAPRTIALWALLLSLVFLPAPLAGALWLAVLVAVRLTAPSGGGVVLARVWRVLGLVPLQFVGYAGVLSWFALAGDEARVILGLLGFILLRWGLLLPVVDRLLAPLLRRLYPLGLPDQTLRAVLTKSALRHRIDLPEIRRMQDRLYEQVADSAGGRIARGKRPRKKR